MKEKLSRGGSRSFKNFFTAHQKHMGFFDFVAHLASQRDQGFERANSALKEIAQLDNDIKKVKEYEERLERGKDAALKTFAKTFGREVNNNVLVGAVDNFLIFLSDLLAEVYKLHPDKILRSVNVPLEIAMSFEDKEEMLMWAVEKKVTDLSYQSLGKLRDFLNKEYKLSILSDENQFRHLSELVHLRNITVHNRGVINHRFISFVGTKYGKYGDAIDLSVDQAFGGADLVLEAGMIIDDEAVKKFKLDVISVLLGCSG